MREYVGTHGINEANDLLFTQLQLRSAKVVRRTPFYQAAMEIARLQYDGIPRREAFNMALSDLLNSFTQTRKDRRLAA